MKEILSVTVELKGSCSGITATQIDRTEFKAICKRSDGYFECFYIKEVNENIFDKGKWVPTGNIKEMYPKDEKFGVTAWCGSEKSIRTIYQAMKDHRRAISDIT